MANKWTNPKPNYHIDNLKQQFKIFNQVLFRMEKENRVDEYIQLRKELIYLEKIIELKELKKHERDFGKLASKILN